MKRADARKAIEDKLADRLGLMFALLADGFEGSRSDCDKAKQRFANGIGLLLQAETFALDCIAEKFPE